MSNDEGELIEVYVDGHDITVEITTYIVVPPWKGSAHTAPSDLDYYGYTDLEYNIRVIEGQDFRMEGEDLDLPAYPIIVGENINDPVSSDSLYEAVAEKLREMQDDGY